MDTINKRYFIDITGATPIILPINSNSSYDVIVNGVGSKCKNTKQLYKQYSTFGNPASIVVERNSHLLTFPTAREAVKFFKNITKTITSVHLVGLLPSTVLLNHCKPSRRIVENLKLLNYIVQALIHEDNDALSSIILNFQDFPIPKIDPVIDMCIMQKLRIKSLIDVLVVDFPVLFTYNNLLNMIENILPPNSYFDVQTYNFNSQSHCPLFCIIYVTTYKHAELLVEKLSNRKVSYKTLKATMLEDVDMLLQNQE